MDEILNLYSGIGGNRTLWDNCQVTSVEYDKIISEIYQKRFKNDIVIVDDVIEFLKKIGPNIKKYKFVWASPPCLSHTRMRMFNDRYVPDMTQLYGLITYLTYLYKGKWCVENVKPWYTPLIKPSVELGRHYFWTNFQIPKKDFKTLDVDWYWDSNTTFIEELLKFHNIDITLLKEKIEDITVIRTILRNCVDMNIGKYIYDCSKVGKKQSLLIKEEESPKMEDLDTLDSILDENINGEDKNVH